MLVPGPETSVQPINDSASVTYPAPNGPQQVVPTIPVREDADLHSVFDLNYLQSYRRKHSHKGVKVNNKILADFGKTKTAFSF